MDDLDFLVTLSGEFGSFMWEYPEKVKEILRELSGRVDDEAVRALLDEHKKNIGILLRLQCGNIFSGPKGIAMAGIIERHLRGMAEECGELFWRP